MSDPTGIRSHEGKKYLRQIQAADGDAAVSVDVYAVLVAFLSLRTHEPDAKQVSYPLYEIDAAARKVEAIFAKHWPVTHAAFNSCGRVAP